MRFFQDQPRRTTNKHESLELFRDNSCLFAADFSFCAKAVGFGEDCTKFTVEVKLKTETKYEFVLTGASFRSSDDFPPHN